VGDCAGCHVDHQGSEAQLIVLDREAFQHAQSRYPLDGAHAALDCESCHTLLDADGETTFRYQGVPYASCDACHLDLHDSYTPAAAGVVPIREVALDAPGPSFVPAVADVSRLSERRACADCHRTSSFLADGLLDDSFQHDSHTEFALEGAHAEVRCGACHTDAIRERERALGTASGQGAERACGECHDDPHRASLGDAASCASCHVAESWTQKFDHTEHTEFALDPLHAQISCESCHEDLRFQSRGSDCAACHGEATQLLEGRWGEVRGEPDPHLGAAECGDCHGESPAENSTTALADRCVDCHTPTYGPLMVSWRSQIDSLAARAERSSEVEWLRKSGLHNFVLSRRLLVERAAAASGAPR
jgi:Zn finger protein HypA/HybF involved in hydrogenase expression